MAGSCSSLGTVARCVIKNRRWVIGFWTILSLGLVYFAPKFADAASISFDPPPGTKSYEALKKMEEVMPNLVNIAQMSGLIQDSQYDVFNIPGISEFADKLQTRLNDTRPLTFFFPTGDLFNMTFFGKTPAISSVDGSETLFVWITADTPTSLDLREWVAEYADQIWAQTVQEWKDDYNVSDRIIFDGTMSFASVANQAIEVAKIDMERVDAVSLPLAGLVLYCVVQSARLLLITLAALGVSGIISAAVLYILSLFVVVEAITPPLVMCLLIAMSIDYSLFLLTRFREELFSKQFDRLDPEHFQDREKEYHECIVKTMETSGATISISGIILAVAFVFLALFPINLIASMGVGCTITMVIMMSVNLTLSPAILASCPLFFCSSASPDRAGAKFWRKFCCKETGPQMTPRIAGRQIEMEELRENNSCLSKVARFATTWPWNVVVLLLTVAVFAATSWPILTLKTTNDLKQDVSYGTVLFDMITKLVSDFGGGIAFPFNVLMIPKEGSNMTIFSNEFFKKSGDCLKEVHQEFLIALPDAGDTTFLFMSYISPSSSIMFEIPYQMMHQFCFPTRFNRHNPPGKDICGSAMGFLTNSPDYLTSDPTATSGMLIASIDPLGKDGQEWLDTLVALMDDIGPKYDMDIYVGGTAAYAVDMVRVVFQLFPIMITATLTVAALFLGFTFRSVVIPLRAIVVNLICLGITYGLSIFVYQYGALNWMNWYAVSGEMEAMPWLVPVVVFFVLTGIGLDYDVFLCVRITEYRSEGADPQTAIVDGLRSVGGIIACAGLVMVVAFGALMFSSIQQLNMLGFMMVISVLFCTMVACTLVNPALLSLLGALNWWPSDLSKQAGIAANEVGDTLEQSLQPREGDGS